MYDPNFAKWFEIYNKNWKSNQIHTKPIFLTIPKKTQKHSTNSFNMMQVQAARSR